MPWDFEYGSTQSFDAGDLTILDGLAEFSIHCPVWLEDQSQRHHVFGKGGSSDFVRMFYETVGVNGKLRIPKLFVGIGGNTVRAEGAADDDFPYQTWTYFGGAFKTNLASGIQVWIDGVKKGEGATNVTGFNSGQTLVNTTDPFYIARRGVTSETWDGKIGTFAVWRVMLEQHEWEALAAGVSPILVRPDDLIFVSYMSGLMAAEWYWLPQADSRAAFTHLNAPVAVLDIEHWQEDWEDTQDDAPSPSAATYGPYTKIATVLASKYRDTMVVNAKTYRYKVRARDTSNNESGDSAVVEATPNLGIPGTPALPSNRNRVKSARASRRARGRRTNDPIR